MLSAPVSETSGTSTSNAAVPQHFPAGADLHTYSKVVTSCGHVGSIDLVPLVGVCSMPIALFAGVACAGATGLRAQATPLVSRTPLPSIGSAGHFRNLCKPCAFGIEKCRSGESCEFCHICKPVRCSKRGRWILKRRRLPQELQSDLSNLESLFNALE